MSRLLAALDKAATALFLPVAGAAGVTLALATLAGRTLILGVVVAILMWLTGLFSAPLSSERLTANSDPVTGLVYSLPKTVLKLDGELKILSCKLVPPTAGRLTGIKIETDYSFSVTPFSVADTQATYLASGAAIDSLIRNDDLNITLGPSGFLKAVGTGVTAVATEAKPLSAAVRELLAGPTGAEASTGSKVPSEDEVCKNLPRQAELPPEGGASTSPPPVKTDGSITMSQARGSGPFSVKFSMVLDFDEAQIAELSVGSIATFKFEPKELVPDLPDGVVEALDELAIDIAVRLPTKTAEAKALPTSVNGVVYRYPEFADLFVCRHGCIGSGGAIKKYTVAALKRFPVYRVGQEGIVPIRRPWFNGRTTTVSFDDTGGLVEVSSKGSTSSSSD